MASRQPDNPSIRLIETPEETTLYLNDGQAMQAWEHSLMEDSADILCRYGSHFLEAGLGLGISAMRIASRPTTMNHTVIEKYQEVINIFYQRQSKPPQSLQIIHTDFFDYISTIEPGSIDGIFFDPFLPDSMYRDKELWQHYVPYMVRALRIGGALVPCFTSRPAPRWQFAPYFDRIIMERREFKTYSSTNYMRSVSGDVFIQCYERIN